MKKHFHIIRVNEISTMAVSLEEIPERGIVIVHSAGWAKTDSKTLSSPTWGEIIYAIEELQFDIIGGDFHHVFLEDVKFKPVYGGVSAHPVLGS